jgi:hypothetical protein
VLRMSMMFPKAGPKPPKAPKPLQRYTPLRPVRKGKDPRKPALKRGRSTGKPTAAQQRRWEAMREKGCVCCRQLRIANDLPIEIHHLNIGGLAGQKRRGHDETVALCAWHHRGVISHGETASSMQWKFDCSLARGSKEFRRTFGTDDLLLQYQNKVIEGAL